MHDETGTVEETKRAVDQSLDRRTTAIESFFASLVTDGYLKYHDRSERSRSHGLSFPEPDRPDHCRKLRC